MAGTSIVLAIGGRKAASWAGLASFFVAVGLVVIYRRFVQKRPLWGRGAFRFPRARLRRRAIGERLKKAGIDPDSDRDARSSSGPSEPRPIRCSRRSPPRGQHSGDAPTDNPAHYLGLLEELHDTGVARRRGVHGGADAPAREPAGLPRTKRRSALNAQSPRDQRNVRTTIASASASWRWSPRASPQPPRPRLAEPGRDRTTTPRAPRRRRPRTRAARSPPPGGCGRRGSDRRLRPPAHASTWLRRETGRLRAARQGAPIRWWWRTATRSAPARRAASRSAARSSCARLRRAALMAERPRRVEPDDVQAAAPTRRLGRLPDPLERRPRAHEASRRVREVVVAGHGEHRRPERAQQLRRRSSCSGARGARDRRRRRRAAGSSRSTSRASACSTSGSSCVPACRSETWRSRAFTTARGYRLDAMAEESARDLRRPLPRPASRRRAAQAAARRGADRTRRRRRSAAGSVCRPRARPPRSAAFAVGTFGLGFTLGGLVFGRWRKAPEASRFASPVPAKRTAGASSSAGSRPRITTSTSVATTAAIGSRSAPRSRRAGRPTRDHRDEHDERRQPHRVAHDARRDDVVLRAGGGRAPRSRRRSRPPARRSARPRPQPRLRRAARRSA